MKQHFLENDAAAAKMYLQFTEQVFVESPILIARGELDKAEDLAKEYVSAVKEMRKLRQRAKERQKLEAITRDLKNKGILVEVVHRDI